jgi:ABC-type Fe3+ transport system permease subunit
MGRRLKNHSVYNIVYALFVLFIVIPVAYTFLSAFFTEDPVLDNIQLLKIDVFILLAKSGFIASIIAVLSTFFGTIMGFLLYKTNLPHRKLFKIALLIPLFISPYILAVAFKDLSFLLFSSTALISSYTGVILVLTFIFTPLSMLIVGSALNNINAHLEEAGFVIAGFKNTLLKIVIPLIKPALITSFVLVFIFSISEFSVPAIFGVKVFTTEIFIQFSAFYNYSLAIFQSALLVTVCVVLLFTERKYISDAPFLSIGGRGSDSKYYPLKTNNYLSLGFIITWFFISVILPFSVLILQAFSDGTTQFIKAFELLKPTFADSIGLAFLGALITVFIGFVAAFYSETERRKTLIWLMLIVFAIPSIILGISLIKFYNRPMLDFIYSGYAIIIIGYVGKFSFIATKLIANAIKQIPNSFDEAAQIEGIGFYKRLIKILIPLILPVLFAAFIISFIFNLGELGMTIMVYPPGTEIMPIKVFTIMANAQQSLTSSMILIVFSITLLIITGMYLLIKPLIKNYSYVNH